MIVFISATLTGKLNVPAARGCFARDRPHEEVGREERPEEHRLRDDEKQDARSCASMRELRFAMGGVRGVEFGVSVGFHQLVATPVACCLPARRRCARPGGRSRGGRARRGRSAASESLPLEGRDDDLVGRVVLDRVLDTRQRILSIDLTRTWRPAWRNSSTVRSSRSLAVAAASGSCRPGAR